MILTLFIGVIIDLSEVSYSKVGTKDGIIAQMFSRNQLAPTNTMQNAQTKCVTKKCVCRKTNILSNSRCHNSLSLVQINN